MFFVPRPIWSVIMSDQYPEKRSESGNCIRFAEGGMGGGRDEDECSRFLSAIPVVTVPFPILALFLNKLSLAVVQM